MPETSESEFLNHEPCPGCGSSDALARYSDGHGYCHACAKYYPAGGSDSTSFSASRSVTRTKPPRDLVEDGITTALRSRAITEITCEKWDYQTGYLLKEPVQIANYKSDKGQIVAQKIRGKDKSFTCTGDFSAAGLYGKWLWRDGGKMVVITEGELDALSVSQAQGNKWPVVSVPNGASGAKKAIQKDLEWLERFETVVFMFDQDKPGLEAANECALLLTPGKAKIASLPLKDASDMLVAGRTAELIDAIWSAKQYRPDGIVAGMDLLDSVMNPRNMQGIPYPWECLNKGTMGLRRQELVTFTAGSGIGKSTACREIAYSLIKAGERVGYIALEESTQRTALGLISVHMNKVLHLGAEDVDRTELRTAFNEVIGNDRVYLYDHFGSTDSDNLIAKMRYMARGLECNWIVLDHLSILVSGIGDGDERRIIDNTMTALRSLVQELNIGLLLVSHLKDPDGKKGHEEGAQITLRQLRGSRAIGQLSDLVIGLERDQQGDDPNITTIRIVKNRPIGVCGTFGQLQYVPETGRLLEYQGDTGAFKASGFEREEETDF